MNIIAGLVVLGVMFVFMAIVSFITGGFRGTKQDKVNNKNGKLREKLLKKDL